MTKLDDIIDLYLKNKNIEGALYINGPWGSGKSYFIDSELSERQDVNSIAITSVYGVDNLDALISNIFSQINPIKAKLNKLSKYLYKTISKVNLEFSYNDYKLQANVDLGDKEVETKIKEIDLLVIDDIERSKIPIEQLFGFIDNLMKECNCKVIIVGYEDEIINYLNKEELYKNRLIASTLLNNSNCTKDDLENKVKEIEVPLYYLKIKEKTLWKEVKFNFDVKTLFDESFINKYESIQDIWLDNRDDIISLCSKTNCRNFRTILSAMNTIDFIFNKTKNLITKNENLFYKNLILISLYNTIKIKHAIEIINDDNIDLHEFDSISMFINSSYFDIDEFNIDLENFNNSLDLEKSKEYYTLVRLGYHRLEDDEVTHKLSLLLDDIKNFKNIDYLNNNIGQILTIFNEYEVLGFEPLVSIDELQNLLIKIINKSNNQINVIHKLKRNKKESKFYKIYAHIGRHNYNIKKIENKNMNFIEYFKTFRAELDFASPLLNFNIQKFEDFIIGANNYELREFFHLFNSLKTVENYSNIVMKNFTLKQTKLLIEALNIKTDNKIKNRLLLLQKTSFNEYMHKIEQYSKLPKENVDEESTYITKDFSAE